MTTHIDLYYTMRSPYCYLSTPRLAELVRNYDLSVQLKPVHPLAVSDATFFERVNPLWPPYVTRDTARIARRLGIPFRWPRPDPIVQDRATRKVAAEQPYITALTRLAQVAADTGRGVEFVVQVSALLFSPQVDGWNTGSHLPDALRRAGLDPDRMQASIAADAERLDASIARNRQEQLAAGHWGAPLFVHDGEIFFGQDRMDDLVWHLQQHGLSKRRA